MLDSDRRRQPRVMLTVAVTLEIGETIIRGAGCRNVSLNGILVALRTDMAVGQQGLVSFTQKCGGEMMSVVAGFTVKRIEPMGSDGMRCFGLEFTQIDTDYFKNLARIVAFQQRG